MTERAEHWQGWLSRWEGSGLTQAEFCRRHGLKAVNFAWWKRTLSNQAQGVALGRAGGQGRRRSKGALPEFVEVAMPSAADGKYEIVLARGPVLRLPRDFDSDAVSRLIAAVESAC